jgi:hypothetical protein
MPQPNDEKTQFRVRISNKITKEIEEYCEWASIKYKDYFIEQACKFIFNSDTDWKEFKSKRNKE